MPRLAVATLALLLAAAAGASAASAPPPPPSALAVAGDAHVVVNASLDMTPRAVAARAAWIDDRLPCSATRLVKVEARVTYGNRTLGRTLTVRIQNCGTGFPAKGFTLKAKDLGLACKNGRWKPGEYGFTNEATERKNGFATRAALRWTNRSC